MRRLTLRNLRGVRPASRRTRGFTLIELLVVVVILGILATTATVGTQSAIQSARAKALLSDVEATQLAADSYFIDTLRLPGVANPGKGSRVLVDFDRLREYLRTFPQNAKQLPGSPAWAKYFVIDGTGVVGTIDDPVKPWGSVDIAGGAETVYSPTVTLDLWAVQMQNGAILLDGNGDPDRTGMHYRLRPDPNFTDGDAWHALPADLQVADYDLGAGEGQKYVYVQFRDRLGNVSDIFFDSVIYTTTPPVDHSDVTPPTAPENLTGSVISSTQIDMQWTAAVDDVAVAGYRVYRSADGGNTWVMVATLGAQQTSYSASGLNPSTEYRFRVTAFDGMNNESEPSNTLILTTASGSGGEPVGDTTPPTKPLNLVATKMGARSIQLTWDAATDDTGVVGYEVWRSTDGVNYTKVVEVATLSYVNNLLTPDTTYYFQVKAFDAAGNRSEPSEPAMATTDPAPVGTIQITNVTGSVVATGSAQPIQADVTANDGVQSVYIYYRELGTSAFTSVLMPLVQGTASTYQVSLPVGGSALEYYVMATSLGGEIATAPLDAPTELFKISRGWTTILVDGFQDTSRIAMARTLYEDTFDDRDNLNTQSTVLLDDNFSSTAKLAMGGSALISDSFTDRTRLTDRRTLFDDDFTTNQNTAARTTTHNQPFNNTTGLQMSQVWAGGDFSGGSPSQALMPITRLSDTLDDTSKLIMPPVVSENTFNSASGLTLDKAEVTGGVARIKRVVGATGASTGSWTSLGVYGNYGLTTVPDTGDVWHTRYYNTNFFRIDGTSQTSHVSGASANPGTYNDAVTYVPGTNYVFAVFGGYLYRINKDGSGAVGFTTHRTPDNNGGSGALTSDGTYLYWIANGYANIWRTPVSNPNAGWTLAGVAPKVFSYPSLRYASGYLYYSSRSTNGGLYRVPTTSGMFNVGFTDGFESGTLATFGWNYNSSTYAGVSTTHKQSGTYAAFLRYSGYYIESRVINLSSRSNVKLSAWIAEDPRTNYEPDSGDKLRVQYYNSSGQWVTWKEYDGAGAAGTVYLLSDTLPADAHHANFRFRFYTYNGASNDYWWIDNVTLDDGVAQKWAELAAPPAALSSSLAPNEDGSFLFTLDTSRRIQVYNVANNAWETINSTAPYSCSPQSLTVADGHLYVACGSSSTSNLIYRLPLQYYPRQATILTPTFSSATNVSRVLLVSDHTLPAGTAVKYEVSTNGGASWTPVQPFVQTAISAPGKQIRVRITLESDTANTPVINSFTLYDHSTPGNYTTAIIADGKASVPQGADSATIVTKPVSLPYNLTEARVVGEQLGDAVWEISANGGSSWTPTQMYATTPIGTPGTALKLRATLSAGTQIEEYALEETQGRTTACWNASANRFEVYSSACGGIGAQKSSAGDSASVPSAFTVLSDGTWVYVYQSGTTVYVGRSSDEGATWSWSTFTVRTSVADVVFVGQTASGTIFAAGGSSYVNSSTTGVWLYRSADAVNWTRIMDHESYTNNSSTTCDDGTTESDNYGSRYGTPAMLVAGDYVHFIYFNGSYQNSNCNYSYDNSGRMYHRIYNASGTVITSGSWSRSNGTDGVQYSMVYMADGTIRRVRESGRTLYVAPGNLTTAGFGAETSMTMPDPAATAGLSSTLTWHNKTASIIYQPNQGAYYAFATVRTTGGVDQVAVSTSADFTTWSSWEVISDAGGTAQRAWATAGPQTPAVAWWGNDNVGGNTNNKRVAFLYGVSQFFSPSRVVIAGTASYSTRQAVLRANHDPAGGTITYDLSTNGGTTFTTDAVLGPIVSTPSAGTQIVARAILAMDEGAAGSPWLNRFEVLDPRYTTAVITGGKAAVGYSNAVARVRSTTYSAPATVRELHAEWTGAPNKLATEGGGADADWSKWSHWNNTTYWSSSTQLSDPAMGAVFMGTSKNDTFLFDYQPYSVVRGGVYTLGVWLKADRTITRTLAGYIRNAGTGSNIASQSKTVTLTPEWQYVSFLLQPSATVTANAGIGIYLGTGNEGVVYYAARAEFVPYAVMLSADGGATWTQASREQTVLTTPGTQVQYDIWLTAGATVDQINVYDVTDRATAVVNTTAGVVEAPKTPDGKYHPTSQYLTKVISLPGTIRYIQLLIDDNVPAATRVAYYVSVDGGATWLQVDEHARQRIPVPSGAGLRVRADLKATPEKSPTIDRIRIFDVENRSEIDVVSGEARMTMEPGLSPMFGSGRDGSAVVQGGSLSLTEDFEDTEYNLSVSGSWSRSTNFSHTGSYAMRISGGGDSSTRTASLVVDVPSGGTVEFYWLTDSESCCDRMTFKIDNSILINHQASQGVWTRATYDLTPGQHTLTWEYRKDGSVSNYTDSAYVDDITITLNGLNLSEQSLVGRPTGDAVATKVTGIGANYADVRSTTGFAVGDEVMLVTANNPTIAANVGNYEFLTIAAISGTRVTFATPVTRTYGPQNNSNLGDARVQMVRVPHYLDLTLDGVVLTVNPFDGDVGGYLPMRVRGALTLRNGATINVDGKGRHYWHSGPGTPGFLNAAAFACTNGSSTDCAIPLSLGQVRSGEIASGANTFYRFVVNTYTTVYVEVTEHSGNTTHALLNASGSQIGFSTGSITSGWLTPGTYFVRVTGSATTSSYSLRVLVGGAETAGSGGSYGTQGGKGGTSNSNSAYGHPMGEPFGQADLSTSLPLGAGGAIGTHDTSAISASIPDGGRGGGALWIAARFVSAEGAGAFRANGQGGETRQASGYTHGGGGGSGGSVYVAADAFLSAPGYFASATGGGAGGSSYSGCISGSLRGETGQPSRGGKASDSWNRCTLRTGSTPPAGTANGNGAPGWNNIPAAGDASGGYGSASGAGGGGGGGGRVRIEYQSAYPHPAIAGASAGIVSAQQRHFPTGNYYPGNTQVLVAETANQPSLIREIILNKTEHLNPGNGILFEVSPDLVNWQRVEPDTLVTLDTPANKLYARATLASGRMYDRMANDSQWEVRTGSPTISFSGIDTRLAQDDYVMRVSGHAWLVYPHNIPFDPSATYEITIRMRQVTDPTSGGKSYYIGFAGLKEDGETFCNASCQDSISSSHYAHNGSLPAVGESGEFTEIRGYIKGYTGSAWCGSGASPSSPKCVHPDVRYIRPLFIVNYSGGNGIADIDAFQVRLFTEDDTTPALLEWSLHNVTDKTTARVDTANKRVTLPQNQYGQYVSPHRVRSAVINTPAALSEIQLDVNDAKPAGTSITYSVSLDGGLNWQPITPGVPTRVSIVPNGDFVTASGWTGASGTGYAYSYDSEGYGDFSSRMLTVTGATTSLSSYSGFIRVLPNTTYILTGMMKSELTQGTASLSWSEYSADQIKLKDGTKPQVAADGTWRSVTTTFTTSASTHYIRIQLYASADSLGTVRWDKITLRPSAASGSQLQVNAVLTTTNPSVTPTIYQWTVTDVSATTTALMETGSVSLMPVALPTVAASGTVTDWEPALTYAAAYNPALDEFWMIPHVTSGSSTVHRYNRYAALVGTMTLPMANATGLWVDADGSFYTVDGISGYVYRWTADGKMVWRQVYPNASAIVGDDTYLYLAVRDRGVVQKLTKDKGSMVSSFSAAEIQAGGSNRYGAVLIGGKLYLGNGTNKIYIYNTTGGLAGTLTAPVNVGALFYHPGENLLYTHAPSASATWHYQVLRFTYPTGSQKIVTLPIPSTSIVREVILKPDDQQPEGTAIEYEVSADGGANWQTIIPYAVTTLNQPGDRVLLRATLHTTQPNVTPSIHAWQLLDTTNATSALVNTVSREVSLQISGTTFDVMNRLVSVKVPLTGNISEVLLTVIDNKNPPATDIVYEVSVDSGQTWTPVVPGEITPVPPGPAVIFRATFSTENRSQTPRLTYYRLDGR